MVNTRIKKLADILVNYSIYVKNGSIIKISFGIKAKELALECYRLILKKGAYAILNPIIPGFTYTYYKLSTTKQLEKFPKIAKFEAENIDGIISIGAPINTKEFTNISSKKISIRSKVVDPIYEIYEKKNNSVLCLFPTHALAQDANMSLYEFEDLVYRTTNIDWKKESKKQDKIKKILDKGKNVKIVSKDTEINFSIIGRKAIKSDGHRNMPGGEVFISPVEKSVEGHICFKNSLFCGKDVDDICLKFRKGKIIESSSKKNHEFLNQMIKTDKGSKYVGEFAIGTNYNHKKFTKNILLDEKMGGTIHMALGMGFKESGGKNKSALHWDMIKDLRKDGEIYIDGKLIQKKGKFMFKM